MPLNAREIETLYKRVYDLPSVRSFRKAPPTLVIKWRHEDYLSGHFLGGEDQGEILLRVPREGTLNNTADLAALVTHEFAHAVFPMDGRHTHGKLFKDIWAILVSELLGVEFKWPRNGNRYYSCDDGWDVIKELMKSVGEGWAYA